MSANPESKSERFQTVTTVLIALVSTAVALVAAQAAVASGNVMEAHQNGVLARINSERVDGASRVLVAQNRRLFDAFRFNRALNGLTNEYIGTEQAAGRAAHETRLRQEAAAQQEESDLAFQFIYSGYLNYDEAAGEYTGFDEATFLGDERQTAAIYEDIDPADNFKDAEASRSRSLAMNLSLIVLFLSVMFLTWAQVTRSLLKWIWLTAGVLIALGVTAAYLLAPLLTR